MPMPVGREDGRYVASGESGKLKPIRSGLHPWPCRKAPLLLGYGILMAGEMLADMDWPMHVQSRGTVRTQVHARAASSPSSLFRLLPFLKSGNNSFGEGREAIDLMYQTMLAELTQRTMDRAWTADFPAEGASLRRK